MSSATAPTPAAIDEFAGDARELDLARLVARDRPLVIRGLVRDWPLVGAARASDTAFAKALAALDTGTAVDVLVMQPQADGIVGYTPDIAGFNFEHFRVPLTQALKRLASHSRETTPPGLAIQSVAVDTVVPGLRREHALALLGAEVAPRLWVGNRVTTPAHFDAQHNLACVVCGRRRFTLFPPEQLPNLYIGPLDFAPTGTAMGVARLDRPDDPRYPKLREALAAAQAATLEPGDAIYLPPLWWHHVESLERLNALVNYWWPSRAGAGRVPGDELDALFHCILAYRDLPFAERAHWRDLLAHYVFSGDEPLAHVPPERRGVLGPTSAEGRQRLRERAAAHLRKPPEPTQ